MDKPFKPSKRYLHNMAVLYGNARSLPKSKMVSALPCPTEESEQIRFVNWLDDFEIVYFSIPNGRSNATEGARQKALGQSPGVPDLCIPYPLGGFHGLFVEMKRVRGGVVSPAQQEWIDWLNDHRYHAQVAYGCDEAIAITRKYFNGVFK